MAEINGKVLQSKDIEEHHATDHPALSEDILQSKVLKWKELTKKKYSEKRKFGRKPLQKDLLPPEILRYPIHTGKSLKIMETCPLESSGMTKGYI